MGGYTFQVINRTTGEQIGQYFDDARNAYRVASVSENLRVRDDIAAQYFRWWSKPRPAWKGPLKCDIDHLCNPPLTGGAHWICTHCGKAYYRHPLCPHHAWVRDPLFDDQARDGGPGAWWD